MSIVAYVTGSETVTTTEWSLTTDTAGPDADTAAGIFELWVDLNALIAGDQYQIRLYEKAAVGNTQRLVQEWFVDGAQAKPTQRFELGMLLVGWDVTLKKIAGTDRLITWTVRRNDPPSASENALALLKLDLSTVTGEAARSLLNAMRFLRNKWTITGTSLSVKKEDDATEAWAATLTAAAGADPISAVDPG